MRRTSRPRSRLTRALRLDSRSLALFRILIAVVVIVDCATRLTLVDAFMGSGGLPNPADPTLFPAWLWSLHRLHGSTGTAVALLMLQIGVTIPVLLGWRSREAFGALTLLTLSLHNGNPYILDGGDRCLMVMMIWACFLPLGRSWSLDAQQLTARQGAVASTTVTGLAAAVFILQIVAIYWITVSHKSVEHWLIQRDAVWYALNLDDFANRFGAWAAQFGLFTGLSSAATYAIQVVAPIGLLWPTRRWQIRMGAITLLAAMHLGFIPFLELGLFPWINLSGLVALIPGEFWDQQRPAAKSQPTPPATSGSHRRPYLWLERFQQPFLWMLISLALVTACSDRFSTDGMARQLKPIKALGVHQQWRMFAPLPNPVERWMELVPVSDAVEPKRLIVPGLQSFDGSGNPRRHGHRLHTQRWRKFSDNLQHHIYRNELLTSYLQFVCRHQRDFSTEQQLDAVEEPTRPLGETQPPMQHRIPLRRFRCLR